MSEQYGFYLEQLTAIKGVMENLASFRPDGKSPADVQSLIEASESIRSLFVEKKEAMDLARGSRDAAAEEGHDLCVAIFRQLKSVFRNVKSALSAIEKLPVEDQSPDDTRERMEAILKLWAQLPNPPESSAAFVAKIGEGTVSRTGFQGKYDALRAAVTAVTTAEENYEDAQGDAHDQAEVMSDFITAALEQGRSQYAEGTSARELIDSVPTPAGTTAPAKAEITDENASDPGELWIEFAANHATRYNVWLKTPTDADLVKVVSENAATTYERTGLAAGAYALKVEGVNSRGTGEASDVVTLAVI